MLILPYKTWWKPRFPMAQPSECGRQRTLNIVHAQTAAQQQCVKLGALKVTPSDPLHQEYLTINLGSTSD